MFSIVSKYSGMTTLISGAAGNLGAIVTRFFLEKGSNIHAACFNAEEEIRLAGEFPSITTCVCDIGTTEGVAAWFDSAPTVPDAVVHLVGGIQAGKPLAETTDAMFDTMITLNTRSTFVVLRQAMNVLAASGGAIITVAAKAAVHPEPNKSAYAAAKAAVIALTLAAAEEGKTHNIRANCIIPGILRTPANLTWAENGEEDLWTPPEHVAQTIYALATTPGINGAVLPLYGKLPS